MEGALRTPKCLKSLELPQFKGPWWRQVSYIFKAYPCRHSHHGSPSSIAALGRLCPCTGCLSKSGTLRKLGSKELRSISLLPNDIP